ncbi:hypothetical protein HPP92_016995 [Vanilla planifolia]|uniref:Uncharacterized protein n=1 Tax=Vanilla planifolia TaxID=51239 RepID=A0A835USD7_VANPL|nr:hypothetical protein HPP92_017575 [Vanilla planifolia]KAG0472449.1 hypothetical protein HPP92_016995 [Vanilla planifolia]
MMGFGDWESTELIASSSSVSSSSAAESDTERRKVGKRLPKLKLQRSRRRHLPSGDEATRFVSTEGQISKLHHGKENPRQEYLKKVQVLMLMGDRSQGIRR